VECHRDFGIWSELERKQRLGNGQTGNEDIYADFEATETPEI
jgi:hypothetical protein